MKRWLQWSLVLNVALAGLAFWATRARTTEPASAADSKQVEAVAPGDAQSETSAPVVIVGDDFHWSQVESTDYREYIENLRAIGCPERTIRDIIIADVNALYEARVRELVEDVNPRFWEFLAHKDEMESMVNGKMEELSEMRKSRSVLLSALFDSGSKETEPMPASIRASINQRHNFLPQEKIDALVRIEEDRQKRISLWRTNNRTLDGTQEGNGEDRINEQKDAEIRAVLSDGEEFEEYELRNSAASQVRYQLADIEVSEAEVRALALARSKGSDDGQIREILGLDRFEAFQQALQPDYLQTFRILDRYDLPSTLASQVYQMQRAAEAQMSAVREDANRSAEERDLLLLALRQETERSLSSVLGPRVFATYQKYHGNWMTRFTETPESP